MTKTAVTEPRNIKRLPINKAGYRVPYFAKWIDGEPDFRIVDTEKMRDAIRLTLCWICGQPRGVYGSYVAGPMCAVNRTSAEPPSHRDCAVYSVAVCPFLATPSMVRRERGLPESHATAGVMIKRNPGVTVIWTSRNGGPFPCPNGVLWHMGEPTNVEWYTHGRPANRLEVSASMESGIPLLRKIAEAEGPDACTELEAMYQRVLAYLPEEPEL
jgi:hypothetical protein